TASATATAPNCGAGRSEKAPRYLPIGVRAADSRKASAMTTSSCLALRMRSLSSDYKPRGSFERGTPIFAILCVLGVFAGNVARKDAKYAKARKGVVRSQMLLRTEHLTKDYGRFRALDDLTLSIAPGELFGLPAPHGCGK